MLLRAGPNRDREDAAAIVWEHGRRNFSLRADGLLAIVCPLSDEGQWAGVAIFDAAPEEVGRLMDEDPG